MVINGDNIEVLKQYPDNYFDAVVTDPPYGLGKEPDAVEVMQSWIATGYHEVRGTGFMGKEWDAFVPQPLFWKEVFRVLKHGGHVLSFFGTRTYDWGVMAMRFAGFEIRDTIQWHYGSGFPKSHNISKSLDGVLGKQGKGFISAGNDGRKSEFNQDLSKRSDYGYVYKSSTENAKKWEGWGSALKPASEPIVLARKPLEKGLSIAENVLKWGTGGINIDGCRVGYQKDDHVMKYEGYLNGKYKSEYDEGTSYKHGTQVQINPQGRFPANLIMTHHPECECKGLKKVKSDGHHSYRIPEDGGLLKLGLNQKKDEGNKYGENGQETVEDWTCHEDCPIKIMDEQSGNSKSPKETKIKISHYPQTKNTYGVYKNENRVINGHNDLGGASRFFYCAKASKSERNRGLEGFEEKQSVGGGGGVGDYLEDINSASGKYGSEKAPNKNFHPTVKPVKLMQYLVRLITPPNGLVLDPFCGSGTTGIACKLEGFQFIGIEQDAEYFKIAEARITNWVEEKEEVKVIEENTKKDTKSIIQQTLF